MFNFFKNNNERVQPNTEFSYDKTESSKQDSSIDIPERIFIEKEENALPAEKNSVNKVENNIELLFDFLDKNHESKGYEDALMNPDISHMEQNIQALKNQLERNIRRVKTFYEDFIREIDFHIESRTRNGLVDIVDELVMKRSIAESHIKKVLNIEEDAKNNIGDSQGMIISYSRGFKNGLTAISTHSILKRF